MTEVLPLSLVPAKIAAFLITLMMTAGVGVFIFFMMLIAMNGYSGSDAEWGLIAYVALTVTVIVLVSFGAVLLLSAMLRKQFSPVISFLASVAAFSVLGAVLEIVCCLAGVGIAEYVRVNH